MRAIQFDTAGAAKDVLTDVTTDPTPPGPGEVLVKVAYAAVNPTDVKRRGSGRELPNFSPITTCNDGAGIIEAVGAEVDPAIVGTRVWIFGAQAGRPGGTAAEYCTLPHWMAPPLPDGTSLEEGACLGVPAVTAYHGIFCDGLVDGMTVLVSGGAGRVGSYAVQMAKLGGATVIATVGNDDNAAHASGLGADHVIDYKRDDVVRQVADMTEGRGVDRVCEVAFGANINLFPEICANNAVITTYSSDADEAPVMPFAPLMFKNITIRPFSIYALPDQTKWHAFTAINDMLASGSLRHRIARKVPFTLEGVIDAHEAIETDTVAGVCLIEVSPD